MLKDKLREIKKKIRGNIYEKLQEAKNQVKDYELKEQDWGKEKQALIDKNRILNLELGRYKKQFVKSTELKEQIDLLEKELRDIDESKDDVLKELLETQAELFNEKLEKNKYKIQCEEYQHQIEDLKSDRYLIRKIPAGRIPNTNKTKISKPMSSSVVRYMRDEHE